MLKRYQRKARLVSSTVSVSQMLALDGTIPSLFWQSSQRLSLNDVKFSRAQTVTLEYLILLARSFGQKFFFFHFRCGIPTEIDEKFNDSLRCMMTGNELDCTYAISLLWNTLDTTRECHIMRAI